MEWNPTQTAIANALAEGQSVGDIATHLKVSESLVYKVQKALRKEGKGTPSSHGEVTPATIVKRAPPSPPTTKAVSEASLLEFTPHTQKFARPQPSLCPVCVPSREDMRAI